MEPKILKDKHNFNLVNDWGRRSVKKEKEKQHSNQNSLNIWNEQTSSINISSSTTNTKTIVFFIYLRFPLTLLAWSFLN
jgi:hypothetical protein